MRTLLVLVLLLPALLGGCSTPGASDPASTEAAVRSAMQLLETGVNREDAVLASQAVGSRFFLGGNIGIRFSDFAFGEQRGPAPFRSFFTSAFEDLANVDLQLELLDLDVSGDIAIAEVTFSWSAVRLDLVPAENVLADGSDYMLFEREAGGWRLMRWDELPPAS